MYNSENLRRVVWLKMEYVRVRYDVAFEQPVIWGSSPVFVWRSVLGMSLRRLVCILRNQPSCAECWLSETCAYSCFFETHIQKKDLKHLPGRDRASHPFVMEVNLQDDLHCALMILFLGRGRNFIPYVTQALENAGVKGIGRNRSPYQIHAVSIEGQDMDYSLPLISQKSKHWPTGTESFSGPFSVQLVSPCRIKEQGSYVTTITLEDILRSEYRRMQLLEELFGDENVVFPEESSLVFPQSEIIQQRWEDTPYYSSRQKTALRLGGVVGGFSVQRSLTGFGASLLKAAEVFHVGKNVSFGLGKVVVEEE